jgi:hypothetical protein
MKQWIMILLLFAASISIAASVELNAGNANIDLGDGYKASFELPDIGTPYVVEDAYTAHTNTGLFIPYGFTISSDGIELASMKMYVYSSPQLYPAPKASTEASTIPEFWGPRIIAPKTISGAPGYVGHDLQKGALETDTSNVLTGFFRCYPGASMVSGDLKGTVEVSGETSGISPSAQSLEVFNSMVESIRISGPGI